MRITRVRIEGFRCLAGLDWRPAVGLNLVLGPNEAGKSALAEFIEAMIFGLASGAESDRRRPWSGGPFGGRLELDCGRFLVAIDRDFASGRFAYQEVNAETGKAGEPLGAELRRGSSGPAFNRYRELFSRHLGFFDERLFRRSVLVPQAELALAARDLSEAASALRTLASGGGSAFDRALELLKERYHNLTRDGDNRRKPGLLDQMRDEKTELAAALRESSAQAARAAELRAAAEERIARLAKVRAEAAEIAHLGELVRERAELLRRRAPVAAADDAQRRRLAAAEDALRAAADLDQRLAAYADLAEATGDFPQAVSQARSTREKAEQIESDLGARRAELGAERVAAWPLVLTCVLLAAGALAAVGGVLGPGAVLWIPGAVALAAGLGLLGWTLVLRSRSSAAGQKVAEEIARLESELARARSQAEAASAELMRQAGGRVDFSPGAMDELLRRYGARLDLAARRNALGAHGLADQALAELRQACDAGVRELAVIDQRAENLAAQLGELAGAEDRALTALPAKSAHLREYAEKLGAEIRTLELDLAAASAVDTAPAAIEERIAELDEGIARQEAHCRALRLASAELAGSIQEFQESHLDRLGALASAHLAEFTGNRYQQARLTGESLRPVVSGAGRDELDEDSLSQGTRAALYLAMRLALGELLAGGRSLPLVFDDPLVDLDDARRAAVLGLLKRLGARTQVLLMSCDGRLAESGAPVLNLTVSEGGGR